MEHLRGVMNARRLTQVQAAKLFHATQPRVSQLVNDRADQFSLDTLVDMLGHGGIRLTIGFEPLD
jgi:predicted XRE-type DNA-binding protein